MPESVAHLMTARPSTSFPHFSVPRHST